jgi:CheY-like chemotaxis protein/anti-sigma regulatory factor (Ser/Thr protein kinase)/anti-anti-sigma regulatory factor
MKIRLAAVEPGLICFKCRGALRQPPKGESTDPLRTLLAKQSWQGNVLLDLSELEFISQESIGWLVHWHRWVTRSGGVLGLCSIPPQFSDLFGLSLLHQLMPIWPDETAARTALAASHPARDVPTSTPPVGPPSESEVAKGEPAGTARPSLEADLTPSPMPAGDKPLDTVVDILVVDDSSVERLLAGNAIESHFRRSAAQSSGVHLLYAGNGLEALTVVRHMRPNLVVTDLMMTELNGLELVRQMRSSYPSIPVVLMTAQGSEDIAAEALREGAASYVPKRYVTRDLGEAVATVLHHSQPNPGQLVYTHMKAAAFQFVLPSDLSALLPVVDFLQGHLRRLGLCDLMDELRVGMALREALVNAVIHGNFEIPSDLRDNDAEGYQLRLNERRNQSPYKDRQVHVTANESPKHVSYKVRDEGPGFDTSALPDPTDPEYMRKATGRGLFLIRTFLDEVKFNDVGNEITMVKRKKA